MDNCKPSDKITPIELLELTGQVHESKRLYERYDKVNLMWYSEGEGAIGHLMGALGTNESEKRIVDIAVHPEFRKRGIGRALVSLSKCEIAYTVDPEAEKFWRAIGWSYIGSKLDKDTLVSIWATPERASKESSIIGIRSLSLATGDPK